MTEPERRIEGTDEVLRRSEAVPEDHRSLEQEMMEQVLRNQRTLLAAVKVLLVWDE